MALQPNILDIIKKEIDPIKQDDRKMRSEFREATRKNEASISFILKDFNTFVSSSKKQESEFQNQIAQVEARVSGISRKADDVYSQLNEIVKQQQELGYRLRKLVKILDIDTDSERIGSKFLGHLKTLFGDKKLGASNLIAAGLGGLVGAAAGSQLRNVMGGDTAGQTGGGSQSGDQIEQILATIRQKESSGDYKAKNPNSSASGAYQFIDGTWQSLTKKYGIGTEFKTAGEAPKEVQDQVARKYVEQILKENNNDVSKVPLVWFTGNPQGKMSEAALKANRGQTGEAYQSRWMESFNKMSGSTQQQGSAPQTSQTAAPGPSSSSTSEEPRNKAPSDNNITPLSSPTNNKDSKPTVNLTPVTTKSGKSAQVDSKSAPQIQGFLNDLEATGYKIKTLGGYADRQNVNDPSKKSFHAYGMAIDINAEDNPNRSTRTDLPPETAQLAQKWGLGWGMNWTSVKDPMHFSTAKDEGGSQQSAASSQQSQNQPSQTQTSGSPQTISESDLIRRIQGARPGASEADLLAPTSPPVTQRPTQNFTPSGPSPNMFTNIINNMVSGGSSTNLITNILNTVMNTSTRMPGNIQGGMRADQIQNAAITNQLEQPNRNSNIRNLDQQSNLDPNNQETNAYVNQNQSGIDNRLAQFLQVDSLNWGSRLASYYGLQQESGMAYNATG